MTTTARFAPLALVAAFLALPQTAHAASVSSIQTESAPGGVYVVRFNAVLDASPLAVRSALLRACDFKDDLDLSQCRIMHREGNTVWGYTEMAPPFVSARDYTSRQTIKTDLNADGTGKLTYEWVHDDTHGPAPRRGVERIAVNNGGWTIEGVDGGKRTRLVYWLRCVPGGVIPVWMARLAAHQMAPQQICRIERVAKRLQRANDLLVPETAALVQAQPAAAASSEPTALAVNTVTTVM